MGVEVPTPAAAILRLASRSASFFFLSLLKPISTRKQQVNTGDNEQGKYASKNEMKQEVWE